MNISGVQLTCRPQISFEIETVKRFQFFFQKFVGGGGGGSILGNFYLNSLN